MNATSFKAGLAVFLFSLFVGAPTARAAETVLIPQGAVWQYKYDAMGPGEGWRGLEFDASSWRSGPAQLGYGDGDEATRIEVVPGPNPETERPITAYFRHRFDILDRSVFDSLRVRLVRDDGAVVYLNGVEVGRSNMPDGAVGPNTLALSTVGGDFEHLPVTLEISRDELRGGANVLAVEVHQVNAASSDLSFALALIGLNGVTQDRSTVSVAARVESTSEPTPTTRVAPAVFTFTRAGGDLSRELPVYVRYEGTATRGTDYEETPTRVVIAAGQSSVDVPVVAIADNLAEPTETASVYILEPPLEPTSVPYYIAADRRSAQVSILNAGNPPEPVVVTLVAETANTSEPLPNALVAPGIFKLTLSRLMDQSLQVIVGYGGTAAAGTDYEQLPTTVMFAPGEMTKRLSVLARADELVEGSETVVAELAMPGENAGYVANSEARRAVVTIADEDRPPQEARIEITRPVTGESFPRGVAIGIRAVTVDPAGYVPRVEFFAGDTRIGVSEIVFVTAPEPGTPIAHEMTWAQAPVGTHHLRARGVGATGVVVTSADVTITVVESEIPTVSMRFLPLPQAIPNADFVIGAAEVRRTGSTAQALQVFYHVNEVATPEMPLATPGVDYERLSGWVVIEAGREAAIVMPRAIDDELEEPQEAIPLQLIPTPPNVDPAYPSAYRVDAEHSGATLYIYDNDTEEDATLAITEPANGQVFTDSSAIRIRAVAVDPRGYVSRVEFYSGVGRIGVSEIAHIVEPAPGTPAEHEFIWVNAPNGVHELTARCVTTSGDAVRSAPVTITVRDEDPAIPVVSIGFAEFAAVPPGPAGEYSPGALEVRRTGPTTEPLQVYYRVAEVSVPERPLATPGADYERLPGFIVIPAGQTSAFIRASVIDDTTPELREYIDVTLTGIPPEVDQTNLAAYQVDPEHDDASLYIIDNDGPVSPTVRIAQPRAGAVFTLGQNIEIRAEVANVANFSRIEILGDGQVIESFDSLHAGYWAIWRNVPVGAHTIGAKLYAGGAVVQAEGVQVLVRETTANAFVHRSLPDSYQPGLPVAVELRADLPAGARAYAVEDRPPVGWTVSSISHEGVFDAATGKVKFGPFTDGEDRLLRYVARPPENADGIREFEGTSSLDGHAYAIGGDRVIRPGPADHPADTDSNNVLTITEVTAYAAAWKSGEAWQTPPNPIPLSFVTRAGFIWRHGENYIFQPSAGAAPYCWAPGTAESVIVVELPPGDPIWLATATRASAGRTQPGVATTVEVAAQPPSGSSAFGVEERVPAGWTVSEISHEGTFDAATSTIRWGIFYDTTLRTLSYKVTPPPNVATVGRFTGRLSADGSTYLTTGSEYIASVNEEDRPRLTDLSPEATGEVTVRLSGPAGQVGILQYSIDLQVWEDIGPVYLPDGSAEFTANPGGRPAGYYRLQIR